MLCCGSSGATVLTSVFEYFLCVFVVFRGVWRLWGFMCLCSCECLCVCVMCVFVRVSVFENVLCLWICVFVLYILCIVMSVFLRLHTC